MVTQKIKEDRSTAVADEAIRLLRHVASLGAQSARASSPILFPKGINSVKLKLEVTGVGSVELEIDGPGGASAAVAGGSVTSSLLGQGGVSDALFALGALPCQPSDPVAAKIATTCDAVYDANDEDCNAFVKAASTPFFGDLFNGQDADGIVGTLSDAASGWSKTKSISDAISAATNGMFVIAGMTSAELGAGHGHLAVVVGCPGQMSGTVVVPIGYAGSLDNPSARIRGARLSGSFPATSVRTEQVTYFSKVPTA